MGLFRKSCWTAAANPTAAAPNPDPSRWKLLEFEQYAAAYVLKVQYLDCTNFEGVKIMVYRGRLQPSALTGSLDPHFTEEGNSPIARFKPTTQGWTLANILAASLH